MARAEQALVLRSEPSVRVSLITDEQASMHRANLGDRHVLGEVGHYLSECWRYRHLMLHLANSDLRTRFRGSYIGAVWLLINPLILTAILTIVFGSIFGQPLGEYAPYVLLGVVLWEFIAGAIGGSTQSIINAEGHLKQSRIPLVIFPLRTLLFLLFCFIISSVSVFAVAGSTAEKFSLITLPWFLPATVLVAFFCAPLAILSSIANMRYRDYQNVITHLITVLYFLSPIFIARKDFERPGLKEFSAYNPITQLCDIFRDPILYGTVPSSHAVLIVLAWSLALWVLAVAVLTHSEPDTIYYF